MSQNTTTSFSEQLALACEVVRTNGWCDKDRLERIRSQSSSAPDLLPTAGRSRVAQFLVEQRAVTREQAQDLDAIIRTQPSFPGFKLMRKLGSGGMGIVFLATHIASDRQCALKTLNKRLAMEEDFVSRFHRESKALIGIKHPNIAEIIDSGESDGNCYLAMEFIDGPSVMALLRDFKVLPEVYALRIVRQVADGLAHVYEKAKLVHRDIKPENILMVRGASLNGELFGDDDQAKLIDFGLVKSTGEDDQRLTQTGMTIGTPLYMSPEQVRGEALDCRSDVYGLGATLYHLVTGVTPFTGTSPGAIMSAHLTEPVPDPALRVPSLSAETKKILATAMAKDPNKRYLIHEALSNACHDAIELISGKSDGALQFLRKPLVLNKSTPVPRKVEASRADEDPKRAGGDSDRENGISSRIVAKHRELKEGGARKDPETHATHAAIRFDGAVGVPAKATASGELRLGAPSKATASGELRLGSPAKPSASGELRLGAPAKATASGELRLGAPGEAERQRRAQARRPGDAERQRRAQARRGAACHRHLPGRPVRRGPRGGPERAHRRPAHRGPGGRGAGAGGLPHPQVTARRATRPALAPAQARWYGSPARMVAAR